MESRENLRISCPEHKQPSLWQACEFNLNLKLMGLRASSHFTAPPISGQEIVTYVFIPTQWYKEQSKLIDIQYLSIDIEEILADISPFLQFLD